MRSLLIDKKMFESDPEGFDEFVASVRVHLIHLSVFYPLFPKWFDLKVVPGLMSGERTVFLRNVNGGLGGLGIIKNDGREKKICCLRVLPHLSGSGLGLKLFDEAFELLGTDRPLLSVSGEQVVNFHRIFKHFNFEIGGRYDDLYRVGGVEYSYNGSLISDVCASEKIIQQGDVDELSVFRDSCKILN